MMRTIRYLAALSFLVSLVASAGALAHSDEYMANQVGPHGGMLRAAGPYHLELRVEGDRLRVWLMDHGDAPQASEGVRGRAMVVAGSRRLSVALQSAGDNLLEGSHPQLRSDEAMRVAVTLDAPGQAPIQARFTVEH